MKIVHAASEMFPYVKTGGLADAVGSLTSTLAQRGHEVTAFIPGYRAAMEHRAAASAQRCLRLKVEMGDQYYTGDVYRFSPQTNLTVYFICRDEWFDRRGLYGNGERDYEDNFLRFLFFQKGVIETLRLLSISVDVVHSHDWQTGLLPLLLRNSERRLGSSLAGGTVFTIHNIAFQGLFPLRSFYLTNLPSEFRGIDGLEYYGQLSLMKGALLFADKVTTVSPSYAREIQTPSFGCGLEGVIATRVDDLSGLINGIDPSVWNPSTDTHLPARYSMSDMSGKGECREALLRASGLTAGSNTPVYGMVCRLSEQKGLDLLIANQDFFLKEDVRLIVLGKGDQRYEEALKRMTAAAPEKIWVANRLDEEMSHLIEAGSDFFLMPSLFEPCGLNQMYSQAYGTIPLVSAVGGLRDTVIDMDLDTINGTGVMFAPVSGAFRASLARSKSLFADRQRYEAVQRRAMSQDFSWAKAAVGYEKLYEQMQ